MKRVLLDLPLTGLLTPLVEGPTILNLPPAADHPVTPSCRRRQYCDVPNIQVKCTYGQPKMVMFASSGGGSAHDSGARKGQVSATQWWGSHAQERSEVCS